MMAHNHCNLVNYCKREDFINSQNYSSCEGRLRLVLYIVYNDVRVPACTFRVASPPPPIATPTVASWRPNRDAKRASNPATPRDDKNASIESRRKQ